MPIIKVFNVFIDTDIIVGIGPMLKIQRVDPMAMAYQEMTFKFDLYTKHYIIPITTDPLSFQGRAGDRSKNEYHRIKAAFELLCSNMKNRVPLDLGWGKLDTDTEIPPPDSL